MECRQCRRRLFSQLNPEQMQVHQTALKIMLVSVLESCYCIYSKPIHHFHMHSLRTQWVLCNRHKWIFLIYIWIVERYIYIYIYIYIHITGPPLQSFPNPICTSHLPLPKMKYIVSQRWKLCNGVIQSVFDPSKHIRKIGHYKFL